MSDFDSEFGARLRLARKERGWSQQQLADALNHHGLDLHRQTIQKLEVGARPVKGSEIVVLAAVLVRPVTYLLEGCAPPEDARAVRLEFAIYEAKQILEKSMEPSDA